MLEEKAVSAMLQAGATLADIAETRSMPLKDVHEFVKQHKLAECTLNQLAHVRSLTSATTASFAEWTRLLADDDEGYVFNGIDTRRLTHDVTPQVILQHFCGETVRCYYTNEPTAIIMPADNAPQNFLLSNLIPIREDVLRRRFPDTVTFIEETTVTYAAPSGSGGRQHDVRIDLTTDHKFDMLLGGGVNVPLVHAMMAQWIAPYLEKNTPEQILECYGLPFSPLLLALWVWRQLEKRAFLKGMARVKVQVGDLPTAYVTKASVLNQVKLLLQRQLGERVIATAQPAVMPPQGRAAQPARLIKL